jgi:hypothetical protein
MTATVRWPTLAAQWRCYRRLKAEEDQLDRGRGGLHGRPAWNAAYSSIKEPSQSMGAVVQTGNLFDASGIVVERLPEIGEHGTHEHGRGQSCHADGR